MRSSKDIRMESEDVRISLGNHSMHVRASFNFVNEGRAQTVTTAFPESITDFEDRKAASPFAIKWFKAWVDGKPVSVSRKKVDFKGLVEFGEYSAVWVKQVSFPAHGRRNVVCEYEAAYSEGRATIYAYYVLRTGATWKGKIGRCSISVDWKSLPSGDEPEFTMEDAPISGDAKKIRPRRSGEGWAKFVFRNFEPKQDLCMGFVNAFWNFRVNGKESDYLPTNSLDVQLVKGTPSDPLIQFSGIPLLLGTENDINAFDKVLEHSSGPPSTLKLHGHTLELVIPKGLMVDGRLHELKRPMQGDDFPFVYVGDLVQALGGTYTYHARSNFGDICIRW